MFAFNLTVVRAAVLPWRSAILLFATLAARAAQSNGQALPTATPPPSPTRIELYAGYGYFRPLSGTIGNHRYDAIQPGAVASATYFFSRYFGAQLEGGAFPQGRNDSSGTVQAGMVARYPDGRITPFVHVLGGLARQRGPEFQPPMYGFGATAGAGIDYVIPFFQHRVAVRLAQADFTYSHVDYGRPTPSGLTGGLGEIKAYRLSAGLVYRFGGHLMTLRHVLMYSCIASPSTIFAGDPVTVKGTTEGTSLDRRTIYTWTTNGGNITGTAETANIATTGLAPGDYTITGHVTQGKHAGQSADCSSVFTVQSPQPPSISCSAHPISIAQGGRVTITSQASSLQSRPLRYSYSASAGQIVGVGPTATLDANSAPPGPITVECRVDDDQRQSAAATTMVNVAAPLPPAVERRTLCSLNFARDRKRPVRVDNEAKACLDDVALTLNREASARLEITGERSADENAGQAAARATNAREYLTAEKGVDPTRIDIRTGTLSGRMAEIELLPVGTPIRYTDDSNRAPAAPRPPQPALPAHDTGGDPMTTTQPAPARDPVTSPDGAGMMSPNRSPDSLVLPPLPPDAVAGSSNRRKHRARAASSATGPGTTVRHRIRRRHKRAVPAASMADPQ